MNPDKAKPTKRHGDRQMTALAGEFFVAAELTKRGLQTSVTFAALSDISVTHWAVLLLRESGLRSHGGPG